MDKIFMGFMTFKDFLCESFEPKIIDYGSNDLMNNKKWTSLDNDFFVTYFESEYRDIYCVLFRMGHFGFGIKISDYKNIETFNELNKYFTFKPRAVGNALRIFNNIIYVITEFIIKIKLNEFYFNGSNEDLKKLYEHMIKDKSFNKVLKKLNFKYVGFESGKGQSEPVYIFKKV